MIGREKELNKLRNYIKPISNSKTGGIIYIYGDAGIGKSYLVYNFLKEFEESYSVFFLQTDNLLKNSLNPFIYFFKNFFNQKNFQINTEKKDEFEKVYNYYFEKLKYIQFKNKRKLMKKFSFIKPIIASLIGIKDQELNQKNLSNENIYEISLFAIKDLFVILSIIKPIIILIEDIQWLDTQSQKIFEILTRKSNNYKIIILATARYNKNSISPKLKVEKKFKKKQMILKALKIKESKQLIQEILESQVSNNLISLVKSNTGNNPFYINQFCMYIKENKLIMLKKNKYVLKGIGIKDKFDLNLILINRIDHLSKILKESVLTASVLGRGFEISLLSEIVDLITSSSFDQRKKKNNKKYRKQSFFNNYIDKYSSITEMQYIFKYSFENNIEYRKYFKDKLRQIHNLAAITIEKLCIENKEVINNIAYHYEKGENLNKSLNCYIKSGDFAFLKYNLQSSLNCYNKAITISSKIYNKDNIEKANLYNKIGNVYFRKGEYKHALSQYDNALKICKKIKGNSCLVADIYKSMGKIYIKERDFKQALNYIDLADNIIRKNSEANNLKILDISLSYGAIYNFLGDYNKAIKIFKKAIELDSEIHRENNIKIVPYYNNLGAIYRKLGDIGKALKYYNNALDVLNKNEIKIHPHISKIYNNIGNIYTGSKKYELALQYHNKAVNLHKKILGDDHPEISLFYNSIGDLYSKMGNFKKSLSFFKKSKKIIENSIGKFNFQYAHCYYNIGDTYLKLKDYKRALKYLKDAMTIYKQTRGENKYLKAQIDLSLIDIKKINNMGIG